MAHCKPEELKDIELLLNDIRCLKSITEKKFGVFYYKSNSFLHFHSKGEERWADVRCGSSWGNPIDLPLKPTKSQSRRFLSQVKEYYKCTINHS